MLQLRRVVGDSMLPSYREGQVLLVNKRIDELHIGDVVVVFHDGHEKLKRISQLRPDSVFILGDNGSQSTDSRSFGWLPLATVRGRVIWSKRSIV